MLKYEIRENCGDWAIWQQYETDQSGKEYILLILNSRSNAEYIKAILEHEARYPNAAMPYSPKVADMSDEECVAVNRFCCSDGYQCLACPLSGSESVGKTCLEVERRVNGLAEKWLELKKEPVVGGEDERRGGMKFLKECYGECLEGIGIQNPHWIVTDHDITPKVGDLVHCIRDSNYLDQHVKVVLSHDEETGKYTVGSRYADPSRDFTFVAEKIFGVVILMFDGDKRQIYERR